MPPIRRLLIFFFLISINCMGCASSFEHIPVDPSDFKRPYSELTQSFPEVKIYEKRLRFPNNIHLASDLVAKWGEPDAIKTYYWYYPGLIGLEVAVGSVLDLSAGSIATVAGGIFALLPGPEKKYTWVKGDYCIDTLTYVGVGSFYRRSITSWTWVDIRDTEKLSKECKEIISAKQQETDSIEQQTKTE